MGAFLAQVQFFKLLVGEDFGDVQGGGLVHFWHFIAAIPTDLAAAVNLAPF